MGWRKLTSYDFSSKTNYLIDNFYQKIVSLETYTFKEHSSLKPKLKRTKFF